MLTGSAFTLSAATYAPGSIKVTETSSNGTVSKAATNTTAITVDKTAAAPSLALASDTGISATDGITSTATVNVTGLEVGATWQYKINGADWHDGVSPTGASTSASFTLPTGDLTYNKGDIQVRQIDKAGNKSDANGASGIGTNTTTWTIDTAAKKLGAFGLANDTGNASDNVTANGKIVISDLETNAKLQYSTDGGVTFKTAVGNSFVLANNTYDAGKVVVKQIDAAGNEGSVTASTVKFVVNDNVPSFDVIATDGVINAKEKAAGIVITGTVKAGSQSVSIAVDGGIAKAAKLNTDGSWSYDLQTSDIPATATHLTLIATVKDSAGAEIVSDPANVIIDLQAAKPTFNLVAEDDAISPAEKVAGVTLTGTTEVGSTVAIALNGGKGVLATVNSDGVWSYKLPDAQIKEGSLTITATATDKAGNESAPVDKTITVLGESTSISAAGTSDAAAGDLRYVVKAGDYSYTIDHFGAKDQLQFPSGGTLSLQNDSFKDNAVTVEFVSSDNKVTDIILTNLATGTDSQLWGTAYTLLNDVLGANTITLGNTANTANSSANTTPSSVTVDGSSSTGNALVGNVTFNVVASKDYNYSIDGFATGDKLSFPTGGALSLINDSFKDGNVVVEYVSSSSNVVDITLTGLTSVQESALWNSDFTLLNSLFGVGTVA